MNNDRADIRLEGILPFEISHLTEMVRFDVGDKDMEGSITNIFSRMSNLREISLENNKFSGPIPGTFADENPLLDTLILDGNKFSGSLPVSLTQLPLEILELAGNQITGVIPEDIGNLVEMGKCRFIAIWHQCASSTSHNILYTLFVFTETLDLRNNLMGGAIPSSLYSMSGLEEALLGGNSFIGNIPSEISQMQSLEVLNLGRTEMGGEIPPAVFLLGNLHELYLNDANFGGLLSDDFILLNGTIREISLENSNFSGTLPLFFQDIIGLGE